MEAYDDVQRKIAHTVTEKASFMSQGTVATASRPSDNDMVKGTASHSAKNGPERANISNATLEGLKHGVVICKTFTNCTLNINFNMQST